KRSAIGLTDAALSLHGRDRSLAMQQEGIYVTASNVQNPLAPGTEQGRLAESAAASRATPRAYGILVVDDEAAMRGVLNIAMRQQGFVVWLAANGREALDLYRRHRAAIDVILLDVRMPGLDGPQTLAALQEINPHVRCCFMSGDLGSYTEGVLRDFKAAAGLPKPLRLD